MSAGDLRQERLHIRPVQPADGPGIVRFLDEVYGHWGSLDDWRWKYLAPPASFRLDSVLAEYEGRIVGHYGLLPLEAIVNGQGAPVAQGIDAGVLPEYRRGGVYTALARVVLGRAIDAGVTLIYAFPGILSLNVNLQHGYRAVAFVPEMVRVLNLWRALRLAWTFLPGDLLALRAVRRRETRTPEAVRRLIRLRRSLLLLASFATTPNLTRSGKLPGSGLTFSLVEHFDARLDALWAQIHSGLDIGLVKDSHYLTWRYSRHPSGCYQIIAAEEGERWVGCLVIRHTGLRSEIADFLVLPERTDVVDGLLAAASAQTQKVGSVVLSIWATTAHPCYAGLRRAGFISSARLFGLAQRWAALARQLYQIIIYIQHLPLEQQVRLTVQAGTWPFSMGDSDLV